MVLEYRYNNITLTEMWTGFGCSEELLGGGLYSNPGRSRIPITVFSRQAERYTKIGDVVLLLVLS